jgi:hypothetical protein
VERKKRMEGKGFRTMEENARKKDERTGRKEGSR